jgi:hypothetical protein
MTDPSKRLVERLSKHLLTVDNDENNDLEDDLFAAILRIQVLEAALRDTVAARKAVYVAKRDQADVFDTKGDYSRSDVFSQAVQAFEELETELAPILNPEVEADGEVA